MEAIYATIDVITALFTLFAVLLIIVKILAKFHPKKEEKETMPTLKNFEDSDKV